jgi:uncharacterized protein YnzC (UPF0291/DUF896 family)
VDLSETAEAIGYKLLPYADDLGDWLLKTGVPAVEGFAHSFKQELGPVLRDAKTWVGDNKDELKDLGGEVVDVVIPAIRDLGGFVGDAVQFFSRLPGPIKSVGAEAAIAAVVIPKLSSAINGVTTSVGIGTTKLGGWRKALLMTAGIAGIGAIEEGARKGNKAVSLMGDALTGAFVGGTIGSTIPVIGTAIGAVGGAAVGAGIGLVKMHKAADQAGDSADGATPKIEGLQASLNQTTGAATRATRALILQKLQQDGISTSAGQLGIAQSDLIKSALGNKKAIERVNEAWEKNGNLLDGLTNQKVSDWLSSMRGSLSKSQQALKENNAALDGTDRKSKKAAESLSQVGKQRPQTDKWSALYTGDLNKSVRFTSNSAESMRQLLSGGPGKARANMGQFGGDLAHQLAGIRGRAGTAGVGIGNAIETGVHSGLSGIISNTVATIQAAIDAAHAAASHGGGKGGGGRGRGTGLPGNVIQGNFGGKGGYGQSLLDSMGGSGKKAAQIAGNSLLVGIVRGIKKGERDLHHVMQGLQEYIQTKTDKLNEILSDRDSFVQSFRDSFSESIFSAQNTDAEGNDIAPTIASMKAFASKQQANAHALADNIRSLLSKGLSRDLIQQLVGQGAAGAQQIAALATGTKQDIADFNASNRDVKDTLEGLGTDLYEALNPGTQDQIKLLQNQIDSGLRQEALLQKIADKQVEGEIKIKGTDLVISIRKVEKQTGKQYFVSPS